LTLVKGFEEVKVKNWEKIGFAALGAVAGYYVVKHWFVTGGKII
jgi:hypothetical protein